MLYKRSDETSALALGRPLPSTSRVDVFLGSQSHAMASRDDKKRIEEITDAEAVPELGKQDRTTAEKISAYFTIAAAAFGLISDGCESPCTSVPVAR